MRPLFIPLALIGLISISAAGYSQSAPKDKPPAKGKKIDSLPGFKKQKIDGFTVMIHDEVFAEQEKGSFKRKPLEALEMELKLVSKVMTKPQADVLRANVLVWVEWDVREAMSNGRAGNAYGLYLGTHPRPILIGKEAVYVSGVRILQMRGVTKRHQMDDAHDTVFLHEFAHAFHDLVLSYEHLGAKDAYKQAMERKLYDKSLYLTTNEREFFAEMTCAYLDTLHHYPHNKAELKKHDAVTYKLMESLWGKRKEGGTIVKSQPEYDLDVKLSALKLGEPLLGPKIAKEDLEGRVVLISFWTPNWQDTLPSLQKLIAWNEELGDFGLIVVGEIGAGMERSVPAIDDGKAKALIRSSGANFPHYLNGIVNGLKEHKTLPHTVVFDQSGACIYRGTTFGAETDVRAALGKAIVEASGVEKFSPALMPFVDALQKGSPPGPLLQKLITFYRGTSGEPAGQAKAIISQMLATGQKRFDAAEKLVKSDPLTAYERLERLPAIYKNTQLAAKATTLLTQLKQDKTVGVEVRGKQALEGVKKIETALSGRPGSFDPMQQKFQNENAALLAQLKDAIEKMRKFHGKTKAWDDAVAIAKRYGIELK